MADRGSDGSPGSAGATREFLLAIAEQRHRAALDRVAKVRADHPHDDVDALCNRVIRQCAKDLAIAGAMSGGAAASPLAGPVGAATLLGTEGAINAAHLGEMVMAIGILHGHTNSPGTDRALWLAAALGASEGTAVGLTGMAARAGLRGGTRLMRRIANGSTTVGGGVIGRAASKASAGRGPWGLAALLPYTLGASVGAAGNLALAWSVGRAAIRYFTSANADGPDGSKPVVDEPTELWEAEFLSERFLDDP